MDLEGLGFPLVGESGAGFILDRGQIGMPLVWGDVTRPVGRAILALILGGHPRPFCVTGLLQDP